MQLQSMTSELQTLSKSVNFCRLFPTGVLTIGEAYYKATGRSVSVWVSLLTSHVMTSLESLPGRGALRHRSAPR